MRKDNTLESVKYEEGSTQREDFRYMSILPSGQTIKIEFMDCSTRKQRIYSIYLVIMDKRKSEANTHLRYTGKDGVLGLFWARDRINEFEEYLKQEFTDKRPTVICTTWDNNTRRDIYYRGLKNMGYRYGVMFGAKAIYKVVAEGEA